MPFFNFENKKQKREFSSIRAYKTDILRKEHQSNYNSKTNKQTNNNFDEKNTDKIIYTFA